MRRRTSTPTEPRVTCQELADVLSWSTGAVITKLAHLRIPVGPDWADRPSVTLEDAARAHERIAGDTRTEEDTWKSYQAYLADREERRSRAVAQAAAQERGGGQRGWGTPTEEGNATRAAAAAGKEFDEREPLVDFESWRPGGDSA